jgi:hypothetical protein
MRHLCDSTIVSPAVWALIGVIIGGLLTGIFNFILQNRQFSHNKEMFSLQNKSNEQAKGILEEMLNNKKFVDRSFAALKGKIGGFSDDEIRRLLIELGAIKTTRPDDNSEWWYLKDRRDERNKEQKS